MLGENIPYIAGCKDIGPRKVGFLKILERPALQQQIDKKSVRLAALLNSMTKNRINLNLMIPLNNWKKVKHTRTLTSIPICCTCHSS